MTFRLVLDQREMLHFALYRGRGRRPVLSGADHSLDAVMRSVNAQIAVMMAGR